jgi:hypothetical protein
LQKSLDTIAIDNLYKTFRAMDHSRSVRKKISMLMSRTYKEPVAKWQPRAAMYGGVYLCGLSLSATNIFGGRGRHQTSIDRRKTQI